MEINVRELILDILLRIERDGELSHIAVGSVLEKYQFLPKSDRAFISRVCEGTVEYRLQLDYIIDCISSVKVKKMKPVIREILRFSVYQLKYMDSVPDRAVVDEAVKLAQKRGFRNLKNFVNGVLRNVARKLPEIAYPDPEADRVKYLSVRYSMPESLVVQWSEEFGEEICEEMLKSFLKPKVTTVRMCRTGHDVKQTIQKLEDAGVEVEKAPYAEDGYVLRGFDYLNGLEVFREGGFQVQDVSSMLVAQAADPKPQSLVIDLCAAPGGKSLHVADRMDGQGMVEARDVTEYKVNLIRENVERLGLKNVKEMCLDAAVMRKEDQKRADLVLADVPCSGYGVIGKKPEIKYGADREKQQELVTLQRNILENAVACLKEGGVLIYSTCTIGKTENQENVQWLAEHFPVKLESLNPYLCEELHSETTEKGYLQLLPGVHKCDGFFLARLRKI